MVLLFVPIDTYPIYKLTRDVSNPFLKEETIFYQISSCLYHYQMMHRRGNG